MRHLLNLLFFTFFLPGHLYSQSTQLKQWFIGPKKVDMSSSIPAVVPITAQIGNNPAGTTQDVANGMYDNTGALMFYLSDNNIYDYNNTLLGTLGYANSSAEAVIVPFGTNDFCQKKFNILTTHLIQSKLHLIQTIVDLSGLTVTTLTPDLSLVIPFPLEFGALAAGTANANGDRFLYFLGGSGHTDNSGIINKIRIHANGTLSFINQILPFPGSGTFPPAPVNPPGISLFARELDLSADGKWLGWAGYTPGFDRYHVAELDPITGDYQPGSYKSFSIPAAANGNGVAGFRGIEFFQKPGLTRFFVGAGTDGIFYSDLIPSSGNWTFVFGSLPDYGLSQIELAYNGLMYASAGITGNNVGAFNPNNIPISILSPNSFGLNSPPPPAASYFFPGFPISSLFTLPDQIDGQDYSSIVPAALPVVLTVNNYTCSVSTTWQYTATGNNPWNANSAVHVINYLEVLPGVTLTVQNMTFKFSEQAKVIIHPGATLIMDGTKFTTNYDVENCLQYPYTWQGIELRGNPNLNQEPTHQGQLTMINNAAIEFAHCGACSPSNNFSGGIIKSINSAFRDNNIDVRLLPYQNFTVNSNGSRTFVGDKSRFTEVRFETSQYYPFSTAPVHVKLDNCYRVIFNQCEFFQSGSTPFLNACQSVGIESSNSLFIVNNNCNFYKLWSGIRATRTNKNRNCFINNSTFDNNLIGIYLGNVNNAVLKFNTFKIGNGAPLNNSNHIGLWLNQCSGYIIEENSFIGTNTSKSTIGILTASSGAADNQIYKNNFSNLSIGNLSNGINRSNTNPAISGLQYLCNTNVNNLIADFSIQNKLMVFHGIKVNQGSLQYGAGNTFSQLAGTTHFFNETNLPVNYFHFNLPAETPITTLNTINYTAQDRCPSRIITPNNRLSQAQLLDLATKFNAHRTSFQNILYNYNQLMDGGNSSQLISQIQQSWSDEVLQLYNEIISLSPYLSEVALRELASSNLLPPALLLNVMLNNPDGTKNTDFLSFLEFEIPEPMPAYMIALIKASWENKTLRTAFEYTLSDINMNKAICADRLLAEQYANEVPDGDSLHEADTLFQNFPVDTLLQHIHTLSAQIDLVEQLFNKGMVLAADSILDAIATQLLLSDDQISSLIAYQWFYSFRKESLQSGLRMDSLNEFELSELTSFRNSGNHFANGLASNILCFYYRDCPAPPVSLSENANGNRASAFAENSVKNENRISAFPNPASKSVHLNYELSLVYEAGEITITDLTGKILEAYPANQSKGQLIISLENFQNGVYFFYLNSGKKTLASGKLLIQH
jgi:hypothetical protein